VAGYRALSVATSAPPSQPVSSVKYAAPVPARRHWAWARLMHRAFEIDVLACPRCGGCLRLIATVEDSRAIGEILAALARSAELVDRSPPVRPSGAAHPITDVRA